MANKISKIRLEQIVQVAIGWITEGVDAIAAYNDIVSSLRIGEEELKALGYGYIVENYYKEISEEDE